MRTVSCNPREEKEALMAALSRFHAQWEKEPTIHAFFDLCDAAERAHQVLTTLETEESKDHETRLQIVCVKLLLNAAMQALELAYDTPCDSASRYPTAEEEPLGTLATMFLPGTILSCADCGEGLYKVTRDASLLGIVVDDGSLLAPLNRAIPARHAWTSLACPLCGGLVLRDGKMHTLQYGWR
jgi:hypothetical protein